MNHCPKDRSALASISSWKSSLVRSLAFLSVMLLSSQAFISSGLPSGSALAAEGRRVVLLSVPGFSKRHEGRVWRGFKRESLIRSFRLILEVNKISLPSGDHLGEEAPYRK